MDITVEELKQRLDKGETPILIDVREPYEYDEFNIKGQLIPLGILPAHIIELDEHKNDEVIVHCHAGGRSATAKAILESSGFTNVRNLLGGMVDWQMKFGK